MKSSILLCQLDSGDMHSVAFPTFAQANDLASKVRKEKAIEIGRKSVPVAILQVITTNANDAQIVKTINVRAMARRAMIEAESKK